MEIVKQAPGQVRRRLHDVSDMRKRMLQLFEEPFNFPFFSENIGWMPDVDISETNGEILVRAELPGIRKEDVEIHLENNVLTLKGEKRDEHEEKEKEHYLYECSYGSFQRSFTLPAPAREDAVRAEFKDGILKIHLPKAVEAKGKKIEITT